MRDWQMGLISENIQESSRCGLNTSLSNNDLNCKDCGSSNTLRQNHAEGTIVCTYCGIVHKANLMDHTKEFRVGGDGPDLEHYQYVRNDRLNEMTTEITGMKSNIVQIKRLRAFEKDPKRAYVRYLMTM